MKKERCMLFFDIDGTLITTDGKRTFPESAKRALRAARERGHLVYINTGRVMANVDEFIRDVGFDGYVCGCGTYIISEGRELLHNRVSQERCREIAYKCRDCRMMAIFEHTEHTAYDSLLEAEDEEYREILNYFKSMERNVISDIEDPDFCFDKFACWYEEGNPKLQEFIDYMSQDFTCIQREGNFLEVVPHGFSKATGIQFLMQKYDFPLERIYAFGDSNNDLDMLRYVQNSIAMGVCTEEVAAVSMYRTDTVEQDGIEKAMQHFGIIE